MAGIKEIDRSGENDTVNCKEVAGDRGSEDNVVVENSNKKEETPQPRKENESNKNDNRPEVQSPKEIKDKDHEADIIKSKHSEETGDSRDEEHKVKEDNDRGNLKRETDNLEEKTKATEQEIVKKPEDIGEEAKALTRKKIETKTEDKGESDKTEIKCETDGKVQGEGETETEEKQNEGDDQTKKDERSETSESNEKESKQDENEKQTEKKTPEICEKESKTEEGEKKTEKEERGGQKRKRGRPGKEESDHKDTPQHSEGLCYRMRSAGVNYRIFMRYLHRFSIYGDSSPENGWKLCLMSCNMSYIIQNWFVWFDI